MHGHLFFPDVVFVVVAVTCANAPSHATEKQPDLYVLSVGVEPSLSAQGQRDWYARDAHYMAESLAGAAPLYETVHSRVLAGNHATRARVVSALEWLASRVAKEDAAIIFFSAHGELDSSNGYHITLARQPQAERLEQGLRGNELRQALKRIAGRVIVVVDTCHAGALVPAGATLERNVSYLVACQATELSYGQWKDPERAHGYFVIAVREGLRGSADRNRDGVVTFLELASYVASHATALCPKQHAVLVHRSTQASVSLSKTDPAFCPKGPLRGTPNTSPSRNPFGQPDVPEPRGEDILRFAATVRLSGDQDDANASAWNTNVATGSADKLDGDWESRWSRSGAPDQWWSGKSKIKIVGDRVFILYQDGGNTYLTEAHRAGKNRLVGRYMNVRVPSDSSPWVGRIVSPQRIDGQWDNGRWDLRRRISNN